MSTNEELPRSYSTRGTETDAVWFSRQTHSRERAYHRIMSEKPRVAARRDPDEERDACVAEVMERAQRHQLKVGEVLQRLRVAREQADDYQRRRRGRKSG
jgi:hypothetical protein